MPGARGGHTLRRVSKDRLIGGRYRIVRKIAEGGMGEVYEAQHNLSKKTVALKILFPHIGKDEAARQRFLREVSAPAQIGHDNIVEVLDAGFDTEDGSLFVAMEMLDGEPMRDRLAKGGVSLDLLLDWFERVLDPLAAAHEKGIVHRDLKPENVFMAKKRDGSEIIKILDFGIARDLDSSQGNVTHTGIAMGTPHYMAPEQAMSAKGVSAAADVWALGVMLYEALVGRPPFDGETASAIVVIACTQAHMPVSQAASHVPAALGAFVDRCLNKDPRDRPQNCGQMLAELRRVRQQIGSVPGVAAAAAGMAAMTSVPVATGPVAGQAPFTPTGTAMLPQTGAGMFGTPPPSAGAFGGHNPSAPGGFGAPPSGGGFGSAPGGYGTSPAGAFGSHPSSPGYGSGPGAFGPPSSGYGAPAYGAAPTSGGGVALGVIAALVVGLVLVVGGGVVAFALLADDEPTVTWSDVRIETNVSSGELFVDGVTRGTVVPNQQFRIDRGQHTLEVRENGLSVASATVNLVAGQPQTVILNRTAPPIPPVNDPNVMLPGRVQTITGQLRPDDHTRTNGQYVDFHYFDWTAGTTVRVELEGSFDPFLIITSPSGYSQENDDANGLNSALTINVTETGRWHVQASSYASNQTGDYTLRVHGP